jgi:putative membrane protein
MHIPEKVPYWKILLKMRGTAMMRIWPRITFVTVLSAVVTYFELSYPDVHENLTTVPFSLIAVALGIFLGFRNNTSYDRFWEGRKLWGRMVNISRSLTRQILTLIGPQGSGDAPAELAAFQRDLVRRVAAYVHAFRLHLRDQGMEDYRATLGHLLDDADIEALAEETNRPVALLQDLGDRFRGAWDRGWIHAMHLPVLEAALTEMTGIQGGCERIKKTPIPFSYTVLIHRMVAVYCVALPFGIVQTVGSLTPLVVLIISFAFFGLDAVGDEIEDPFGTDPNDLPLTNLSTMIERNIRQRIGDEDLPPMPAVREGSFID